MLKRCCDENIINLCITRPGLTFLESYTIDLDYWANISVVAKGFHLPKEMGEIPKMYSALTYLLPTPIPLVMGCNTLPRRDNSQESVSSQLPRALRQMSLPLITMPPLMLCVSVSL